MADMPWIGEPEEDYRYCDEGRCYRCESLTLRDPHTGLCVACSEATECSYCGAPTDGRTYPVACGECLDAQREDADTEIGRAEYQMDDR